MLAVVCGGFDLNGLVESDVQWEMIEMLVGRLVL
jgi:hypothetical protein